MEANFSAESGMKRNQKRERKRQKKKRAEDVNGEEKNAVWLAMLKRKFV